MRRLAGAAATLAAMWGLTAFLLDPPDFILQRGEKPAAPRAEWLEIVKPLQIFAAPSPAFGMEPRQFTARRHTGSSGRVDTLVYGAQTPGTGNWLRLEIHRFGGHEPEAAPLYVEMARQAGRASASIARLSLPGLVRTRFGAFEIADVQLQNGERYSACLGFRLREERPGFAIAGLACGTAARPLARPALACALERIDLLSAGEDRQLGDYFAAAELKRNPECGGPPATRRGGKPDWLAEPAETLPLKGSLAAAANGRRR